MNDEEVIEFTYRNPQRIRMNINSFQLVEDGLPSYHQWMAENAKYMSQSTPVEPKKRNFIQRMLGL